VSASTAAIPIDLDELRALHRQVAPPTLVAELDVLDPDQRAVEAVISDAAVDLFAKIPTDVILTGDDPEHDAKWATAKTSREFAFARLIVGLVNAAPQLLGEPAPSPESASAAAEPADPYSLAGLGIEEITAKLDGLNEYTSQQVARWIVAEKERDEARGDVQRLQVLLDTVEERAIAHGTDIAKERITAALAGVRAALGAREGEGSDDAAGRVAEERARTQRLLGRVLDVLCLPGHAVSRDAWLDALTLGGRYCEPFLSWDFDAAVDSRPAPESPPDPHTAG
jgi:hypothetical protein